MVPNQSVNPYLKNTAGSTFTNQTFGGTIIGLSSATSIITKAIQVKDVNASDPTIYTYPKLLSGARTYNTAKILSAGTFAYNAAINRTWILTRVTTSLAGVSKTFLQFMANVGYAPSIAYYVRDNWVTAGTDFGTSGSLPSRAYPGELYILNNFIDYKPATSSNKYYYKPITGM